MAKRAGVLLPLFSIRTDSSWGLGEIPDLVPFARWAQKAGCSVVQLLPVNQPSGGQNSPYAALTAFALDPVYLALGQLPDFAAAGGEASLDAADRAALQAARVSPTVQWSAIRDVKSRALERAFTSFLEKEWASRTARAQALEAFVAHHGAWLNEFALFEALHEQRDGRAWTDWEPDLARRAPEALAAAQARLERPILFIKWVQWQLDEQWRKARAQVNDQGVKLMGDLPFVVAGDSADVWSDRADFRLDVRVGVPPDAFSATGQDWGLPVYRWDVMAQNGLRWFRARSYRAAELFDYYRVDHVVGIYRTYYRNSLGEAAFTPDNVPAQTENGERVLRLLSERATVIAEDLGTVPDFVRTSLTRLGIPGYRVLRWEKDLEVFRDPLAWPALSVAVSGTHDTDSVADWYESMPAAERAAFLALPSLAKLKARNVAKFDDGVRDAILELLYASGSDLTLVPFQDLLGHRERVNTPGTVNDVNWTYRMPMSVAALEGDAATNARLVGLAQRFARVGPAAPATR
jgi:4-alpha-glucanotransferase